MDNEWYTEADPGRWHLMKERMTVTVIFILFVVVFCMVALRLYVRWYVLSQLERRAMFGNVVFYGEENQLGADRGLEPEVLDSLPVFHYSMFKKTEQSTQECSVCLSEFEENDVLRLLPKCNHSFHVDCIDMWLHSHSTCPICRSKVEAVANVVKPASTGGEMVVEVCRSEPGSSSGVRPGNEREIANTTSLEVMGKHGDELVGSSTEVSPPIQAQLDCELTQSSAPRLSSFKKILEKSSIDGGGMPPTGNSRGPTELDLESGPSQSPKIRRPGE